MSDIFSLQNDWNDASVTTLEQLGKDAPPFIKYAASKTLAERAAWEIVNETGSQFDLVAVAPTFIWGVRTLIRLYRSWLTFPPSKLSARPPPTLLVLTPAFLIYLRRMHKQILNRRISWMSSQSWTFAMRPKSMLMHLSPLRLEDGASLHPLEPSRPSTSVSPIW